MTESKETETLHEVHTDLHNEHGALVKGQKASRAVFIVSTMVLWLLTMFVITALNQTNRRLEEMQANLDIVTSVVASLPSYEVTNAQGEVVYRLALGAGQEGGDVEEDTDSSEE